MKNFLMFDVMITPWIIRILYSILQAVLIVFGLYSLFAGDRHDAFGMGAAEGLLILIGGTLFLRLFCEMLIVQFKISENTSQLKEIMKKNQSSQN